MTRIPQTKCTSARKGVFGNPGPSAGLTADRYAERPMSCAASSMTLAGTFPATHFRHFGLNASCDSSHPGDSPPGAPYPTCSAAYGTSRFPNHSPSSTPHPACHSASSSPGLTRCPPRRPSRTTLCPPCLSLRTSHVCLRKKNVPMPSDANFAPLDPRWM